MKATFDSYPEMINWLNKQDEEIKSNFWWTVKYINKEYKFILRKF